VIAIPAANEDGISGGEALMDHANATEGAITADERERMALGVWLRRRRDLLAPFARDGQFRGLTVEDCETNVLADAAWADYERDGNVKALANKQAMLFRTVFAPTLAGALARNIDAEQVRAFSSRLESGLERRLACDPQPINSLVQTIVLAKNSAP
jgi:hypothetical protein